jgi:hypothetical protein
MGGQPVPEGRDADDLPILLDVHPTPLVDDQFSGQELPIKPDTASQVFWIAYQKLK